MAESTGFGKQLFQFLRTLEKNNNRDWFTANKPKYESNVLEPALSFVRDFRSHLTKISPHFVASDRRSGGSVMRIYRDVRFSSDKRPYKTNVGIHFRHERGKDVHAPGFYIHIETKESFLGVGIWHPDSPTIKKIRTAILDNTATWKRARDNKRFRAAYELSGDSLKTAPRGIPKDHPLLDDLRKKDHIAFCKLTPEQITSPHFLKEVSKSFALTKPYMSFLCKSVGLGF